MRKVVILAAILAILMCPAALSVRNSAAIQFSSPQVAGDVGPNGS